MKRSILGAGALVAALGFVAFATPAKAQFAELSPWNMNDEFMGWDNQNRTLVRVGIEAIAAESKAEIATLQGQYEPAASFVPQAPITAKTENKFAGMLTSNGAPLPHDQAISYIRARFGDYVADAKSLGEQPNNIATACAYFSSMSLQIENDRVLTPLQRRAVRGDCVVQLAGMEAGWGVLQSESARQSAAEMLMLFGAMPSDRYAHANAADRQQIKAAVEARFKKFFTVSLSAIKLDNLACGGSKDPKASVECAKISNEQLASIADHTH